MYVSLNDKLDARECRLKEPERLWSAPGKGPGRAPHAPPG